MARLARRGRFYRIDYALVIRHRDGLTWIDVGMIMRPSPEREARMQKESADVSKAAPYRPPMSKSQKKQAVESLLGVRERLADYRPSVIDLSPEQREEIIEQAQILLEDAFVHLPLKRAMHATEPIQRLRLLKLRHRRMTEREFQCEMIDIFTDLRDLHTNYVLPAQYRSKFAFLPFRIEECYEPKPEEETEKERKYVVSWVSPICTDPNLREGVVVTHWNGSPIEMAVGRNAEREAGSNMDARRARGIEALTLRWLGMSLPPDEDWVVLSYTDGTKEHESRFDWEVVDAQDLGALLANGPGDATAAMWGIDLKTDLLQRVRKALFDPAAVEVERQVRGMRESPAGVARGAQAPAPRAETSVYPDVFPTFGTVSTTHGEFGYIRLRSFAPPNDDVDGAVGEFTRLLKLMPQRGLILDVRGNGGGIVWFGERILQMLTPREITPEPFHFIATPLTHRIAQAVPWLESWGDAIRLAIETGASYSQGFPITPPEKCNDIGQIYQGPVVLVTDALCYSTTDIFAAGFQDHAIGDIVGVHHSTGAGGANVWDLNLLRGFQLPGGNPFKQLPGEADMRAAVRRSTRVGARSGVPLEDLGVEPNVFYEMTPEDVLGNNEKLIAFCAERLSKKDRQVLTLKAATSGLIGALSVSTEKLDRVDILVNGRVVVSVDVADGATEAKLPKQVPPAQIAASGYRKDKLVVRARLTD